MPDGAAGNPVTPHEVGLDPPPRRVPLSVQIVCVLGGTRGCMWWALFFAACGASALLEALADRDMVAWSIFGLVVFVPVTVLSLVLVARETCDGLMERRLLVHGQFAVGRVIDDRGLNPKISRVTLEVTDDSGQTREVQGTAIWDDSPEPQPFRRVLYDPVKPQDTLLLDNGGASNPPRLNGRGGFRRAGINEVFFAATVPLLVLLVPVREVVVILLRWPVVPTE